MRDGRLLCPQTTLENEMDRASIRRPEGGNENVTVPVPPTRVPAPDYAFLRKATDMFESVATRMMEGQNVSKDQIDSLNTLHGDIIDLIDHNVQLIKMQLAQTLSMAESQRGG